MGGIASRRRAGVEEVNVGPNNMYKYPPRSGNYFSDHFIMGGERFETSLPECYLFGENADLNFLGSRPTSFPYPPPQASEPTKTLKSLVNIRKESLRFVRAPVEYSKNHIKSDGGHRDVELGKGYPCNLEFVFDCDVRCTITIYYFCTEDYTPNGVTYIPRDPSMTSETFHFKRGANQQFCQMTHVFDPSRYSEDELLYDMDREIIPIAIHCVAEEGPEDMRQSHTTIATVEKCSEGTYLLKALKQKLFVDGLCYLLQEIYGIENKLHDKTDDDDGEDNGSECVICMCDVRDTLILPCRHLCLCNSCADSLRYQANNCPICRAPFRALLQIRALQKSANPIQAGDSPDGCYNNIPPGYESVSLIEALNGPCIPRTPPAAMPDLVETPDNDPATQAAQILNRRLPDKAAAKKKEADDEASEFGMSILRNSREENKETQKCPLLERNAAPRGKHQRVRFMSDVAEQDELADEDSEAEKLSPLLDQSEVRSHENNLALNMADVLEPIDGAETEQDEVTRIDVPENDKPGNVNGEERADESDYYTPEDPAPVENTLYDGVVPPSSVESTPQHLPDTPLSHASSLHSSNDSYNSESSTRHLLAVVANNASPERAVLI